MRPKNRNLNEQTAAHIAGWLRRCVRHSEPKTHKMKTDNYKTCKICGGHKLPVIGCHCTEAAIRNLKIAQELLALGEIEAACGRIDCATEKIKRAAAMPNTVLNSGSAKNE